MKKKGVVENQLANRKIFQKEGPSPNIKKKKNDVLYMTRLCLLWFKDVGI